MLQFENIHEYKYLLFSHQKETFWWGNNGAYISYIFYNVFENGCRYNHMYVCMYMHNSHTNNFFIFFQLSIDDLSHYGDAYSTGNQGTAFYNLKVAMEAANSSAVLPSVDLSSSSGNNDELLHLIRKMASGLVKELNPEGKVNGLKCVCPCFNLFSPISNLFVMCCLTNG